MRIPIKAVKASHWIRCNLCTDLFRAYSVFQRFCEICKNNDERYRYAEWLPGSLG